MTEVALAVGAVVLLGAIALLPFFVSFLSDLEAKVAKLRAVVPDAHDLAAAGRPPAEPVGDTGAAGSRRDHAE